MRTFSHQKVITSDQVPKFEEYKGMRIVDCFNDEEAEDNFQNVRYSFQQDPTKYIPLTVTMTRKGTPADYRLVAFSHLSLQQFVDVVKYDPSDPHSIKGYDSAEMREAHEQTQSDFKGQKMKNMHNFKEYILEGIQGIRPLYLPTICGWQSEEYFDDTVFVSLDGNNPNALYGRLFLPKKAVMQADGQTQTAALFRAADTKEARDSGEIDKLTVTLEIELNMNETMAGNSFADRNGRGTKKNLNLVQKLDTSSPQSKLRLQVVPGTVFEGRLADGRTTGTSVTATANIIDLNTLAQIFMEVTTNGKFKPSDLKHHHIQHVEKYCKEFLEILGEEFGQDWKHPIPNPKKEDTYRRLYVHGWPFALKALAKVYFNAKVDELTPIVNAMSSEKNNSNKLLSAEDNFNRLLEEEKEKESATPKLTIEDFKERLHKIDWLRYRKHWIDITGHSVDKNGEKRTFTLKSTGEKQVVALAQNNANFINAVANKIMSDKWSDLCKKENEPLT
ncbi:hypothetical protein J0K78_10540 [Halobacillus sp. GSS1]|uniref:DNA sulfur modification protein DndB n=1 Tax=Halobacillus sp. GSS1 TaxID=2815919 RepID=UPI001A8DFE55|nr:DNA sulfur modification protein DndB [Halobacillus sp. GSS1]MBN9654701.1 hypothetical protein [Halobacillus sp. GSS1]